MAERGVSIFRDAIGPGAPTIAPGLGTRAAASSSTASPLKADGVLM